MRSAAYWAATDGERRAAHRTLAEAVPHVPPSLSRAWHLALSTFAPDEEIAAELATAAEDAAHRGAHGSAGSALERASRLTLDSHVRAHRLVAAAENLHLVGQFKEAFALLDEAIATTTDAGLLGRAYLIRGQGLIWVGSPHDAHAILAEGASRLEAADPATAALLRAESAHALMPAAYPQRCLAIAEQARATAAQSGGQPLVVATAALAQASLLLGEAQRSAALIAEATAASTDQFTSAHFMILRASFLAVLGKYDESRALFEDLIGAGRGQSAPSLLPYPLAGLAYVDYRTGRWTRAYAEAAEAVDLARETGQLNFLAFCLCALGQVEAGLGRGDACRLHTAEALSHARSLGSDAIVLYAGAAHLLAALGEGRFEEGIVVGESVARLFDERGYREPSLVQCHGDLVEAYVRAGRTDDAKRLLGRFEELAHQTGGAWALGVAARCRGLLGAEQAFETEFSQAVEDLEWARAPFELARTQLCLGERRRRARRRIDARGPLRAALETFENLGARPWADRAQVELAASGERAKRRDPTAAERLTPQELQVALAIARGTTNREAAAELFLSPKTIEFHLGHIYRKLGIRSRSQLTRLLADREVAVASGHTGAS
jgi:DNA-binding CsgD family transcriptional regulator